MPSNEIRRLIEKRLLETGRDSSPQTIDQVAEQLAATKDPDFIKSWLNDPTPAFMPEWVPAAPTGLAALGRAGASVVDATAHGIARGTFGLLDLVTGGQLPASLYRDRMEQAGYDIAESQPAAVKEQRARIDTALEEGAFVDSLSAAVKNPLGATPFLLESFGMMLPGGVVGRGVAGLAALRGAGPVASAVSRAAPGIGEGAVAGGVGVTEAGRDGDVTPREYRAALLAGVVTGLVSRVGGKMADELNLPDPDAIVMGRFSKTDIENVGAAMAKVAQTTGTEGLEESAQEFADQYLQYVGGLDGPPTEEDFGKAVQQASAASGMGAALGGAMGAFAGAGSFQFRREPPTREQLRLPPPAEPAPRGRQPGPAAGPFALPAGDRPVVDVQPVEPESRVGKEQPHAPPVDAPEAPTRPAEPPPVEPAAPATPTPESAGESAHSNRQEPPAEPPDRLQAIREAAARAEARKPKPKKKRRDEIRERLDRVERNLEAARDAEYEAGVDERDVLAERIANLEAEQIDLYEELNALPAEPDIEPEPEVPPTPEAPPAPAPSPATPAPAEPPVPVSASEERKKPEAPPAPSPPAEPAPAEPEIKPPPAAPPAAEPAAPAADDWKPVSYRGADVGSMRPAAEGFEARRKDGETRTFQRADSARKWIRKPGKETGAAPAAPAPKPEPERPQESPQPVEDAIRSAYRKLNRGTDREIASEQGRKAGDWIELADLRDELGEKYPRGDIDAALKSMFLAKEANLTLHEAPDERTKPRNVDSALRLGVDDMHMLSLADAPAEPEPETPLMDRAKKASGTGPIKAAGPGFTDAAAEKGDGKPAEPLLPDIPAPATSTGYFPVAGGRIDVDLEPDADGKRTVRVQGSDGRTGEFQLTAEQLEQKPAPKWAEEWLASADELATVPPAEPEPDPETAPTSWRGVEKNRKPVGQIRTYADGRVEARREATAGAEIRTFDTPQEARTWLRSPAEPAPAAAQPAKYSDMTPEERAAAVAERRAKAKAKRKGVVAHVVLPVGAAGTVARAEAAEQRVEEGIDALPDKRITETDGQFVAKPTRGRSRKFKTRDGAKQWLRAKTEEAATRRDAARKEPSGMGGRTATAGTLAAADPAPVKPTKSKVRRKAKPAKAAKKLALEGVRGAAEALSGLEAIFTPDPTKLGAGLGAFDEQSYQKAKPHFQAAWKHYQDAGKAFGDFIEELSEYLIDKFGLSVDAAFDYMGRFSEEQIADEERVREPATPAPAGRPAEREEEVSDVQEPAGEPAEPTGDAGDTGRTAARERVDRDGEEQPPAGETEGAGEPAAAGAEPSGEPAAPEPDSAEPGRTVLGGGRSARTSLEEPDGIGQYPGDRPAPYTLTGERMGVIVGRGETQIADDNVHAMEVLNDLQRESRYPTAEEQDALAKWIGWGASGVAQYLDEQPNERWSARGKDIHARLKRITTAGERVKLRESKLNAHYTFGLYTPIWDALKRYGFQGGRVLEPAIGSGHAVMLMPQDVRAASTISGYDIEPQTAHIAKALSPDVNVHAQPYQKSTLPAHSFDLAISNVPFGKYPVADPQTPFVAKQSIHNYFFAKAMQHLKPGGVLAFLTTHFTMDAADPTFRTWLAERADFLGAVRLPQTAFKEGARTEVITDVIFMRRRAEGEPISSQTARFVASEEIELWDREEEAAQHKFPRSLWYTDHPEFVLGEERATGVMRAKNMYNVEGEYDPAAFAEALEKILPTGAYVAPGRGIPTFQTTDRQTDQPPGSYLQVDGKLVAVNRDGQLIPYEPVKKATKKHPARPDEELVNRIVGHLELKDAVSAALDAQLNPEASEDAVTDARKKLRAVYDRFNAKWGRVNDPKNRTAFGGDPAWPRMSKLETTRDVMRGNKMVVEVTGLAPVFEKRVVKVTPIPAHIPAPHDAMLASLSTFGTLNWRYMSEVSGKSETELQNALLDADSTYVLPDGSFATAEEYLSGDVVTKLDAARALVEKDKRFERNVAALEARLPKPYAIDQITVQLGAPWIAPQYYADFIDQQLDLQTDILPRWTDTGARSFWTVPTIEDRAQKTLVETAAEAHPLSVQWEGGNYNFLMLMKAKMNLASPTLKYKVTDADGKKREVTDEEGTLAVRNAIQNLNYYWESWLSSDADRLKGVQDTYNERFNRTIGREYDTKPIMPALRRAGFALPSFYKHQHRAVYRAVVDGNTLIAHDTGAGKTFELISIAMMWKRMGRANKPVIVVENQTVSSFRKQAGMAFPGANALFLDADTMSKKASREAAIAQLSYGEFDFAVITRSGFEQIPTSVEQQQQLLEKFLADIQAALTRADADDARSIQAVGAKFEEKLAALEAKKDSGVTWDQTGIDGLLIDEAHFFKNLFFSTKLASKGQRVKGINPTEAQRAFDMFAKISSINDESGERNVVMATATPVMNTPAEFYTFLRYLAPSKLRELGIQNFDAFYSLFLDSTETDEPRPDGSTKRVRAINRYLNLKTLHGLFSQVTDYVPTRDMPYLKLPKIKGGSVRTIQTPKHPMWDETVQPWINERMRRYKANPFRIVFGEKKGARKHHPITGAELEPYENVANIINDSAMAAIDLRLVKGFEDAAAHKEGRVAQASDIVSEFYHRTTKASETTPENGTALVFADIGIPANVPLEPLEFLKDIDDTPDDAESDADDAPAGDESTFHLYNALRDSLAERGVKRSEIAYVQQAKNEAQRRVLFEKMNRGEIRVLIASTEKGGTGVNVQERLGLMVHMDVPRNKRPGDLHQRDGRGVRQGNLFEEIEIVRFVTPGTADEFNFTALINKAKFIDALMDGTVDKWEDITLSVGQDLETAQRLATGDPRVLELRDLNQQQRQLEAAMHSEGQKQRRQTIDRQRYEDALDRKQEDVRDMEKFHTETWKRQTSDEVDFTVEGGYYSPVNRSASTMKDANAALESIISNFVARRSWNEHYFVKVGGMEFSMKIENRESNAQRFPVALFTDQLIGAKDVRVFDGSRHDQTRIATNLVSYYNDLPKRLEKAQREAADRQTQVDTITRGIETESTTERQLARVRDDIEKLTSDLRQSDQELKKQLEQQARERAEAARSVPAGGAAGAASFQGYEVDHVLTGRDGRGKAPDDQDLSLIDATVMPAGMTELNTLIEELGGELNARKIRGKAAGRFIAPGRVLISPELFATPAGRRQARAIVAHEIGHFLSWRPGQTFAKGNVLGHLAGLQKFLKGTFSTKDGAEFKARDIRQELIAWTKAWKPLSKEPTDAELAYRFSSSELFADAISGLLMNPNGLKQVAPTFYKAFFNVFPEQSPEMYDAYLKVRGLLAGPHEARVKHVRAAVRAGFARATEYSDALSEQEDWTAKVKEAFWHPVETFKSSILFPFMQRYVDRAYAIRRRAAEKDTPPAENPYYDIWSLPHQNHRPFLRKYFYKVVRNLADVGLSANQEFSELLTYKRIAEGDRSEFLNVAGLTGVLLEDENVGVKAGEAYDDVLASVTEEQKKVLLDSLDTVYEGFNEAREKAEAAGLYTPELADLMRSNAYYAPFQVAEYIGNGMSWKVHEQKGSAKEIAPTFEPMALKAEAMLQAAETNSVRVKAADWLRKYFPDQLIEWENEHRFANDRWGLVSKKGKHPKPNLHPIRYYEKGKPQDFLTDRWFAQAIMQESVPTAENAVLHGWDAVNNAYRQMVIQYSMRFWSRAVPMDIMGVLLLHPKYKAWKWPLQGLRDVVRALPGAVARGIEFDPVDPPKWLPKWAKKRLTNHADLIRRAEEQGIFGPLQLADYVANQMVSGEASDLIKRTRHDPRLNPKVTKPERRRNAVKQIHETVQAIGNVMEAWPRVMSLQGYVDMYGSVEELPPDVRHAIQGETGPPMFARGGTHRKQMSRILAFASGATQGVYGFWQGVKREHIQNPLQFYMKLSSLMFPLAFVAAWRHGMIESAMRAAGLEDDDEQMEQMRGLRETLNGLSEYDRRNFFTIPLGAPDDDGSGWVAKIPRDYGTRAISGALDEIIEKGVAAEDPDILNLLRGLGESFVAQLPGLHPLIEALYHTGGMAASDEYNPFDRFRQTHLFSQDEMEGGTRGERFKKFGRWWLYRIGTTSYVKFSIGDGKPKKSDPSLADTILEMPFVGPVASGYMAKTDYGWREMADEARKGQVSEDARLRLAVRERLQPLRQEYENQRVDADDQSRVRTRLAANFATQLGEEFLDADMPKQQYRARVRSYERLANRWLLMDDMGSMTSLLFGTNAEAGAIARAWIGAGMPAVRIRRFIDAAYDADVMSGEKYDHVYMELPEEE